jgi:hypothetical protein
MACNIPLKRSQQELELWLKPHLNQSSAHKVMSPKVARIPTLGISGLPFESHRTKWHLGAGPMPVHRIYYKREGGGFSKSGPWWILWVCVCPWLVHAPKCSNYALSNLLFGLCTSVWISELLVNLPNPTQSSSTPIFPQNAVRQGAHPNSFSFNCLHL